MSRTSKWRLLDRVALFTMAAVFCSAIMVLAKEFWNVSAHEVVMRLAVLPRQQILVAAGLTAVSYMLLTGYDFLALQYVRRRLRFRDVIFTSFTAFALSNNIGFQLISGGSARYRIYKSYGFSTIEIGAIVVFCTIAYALGVVTVSGLLALIDPLDIANLLHVPQALVIEGGFLLLGVSLAYFAVSALWHKPVAFAGFHLRPPSLPLAIAQVALASVDAVAASTVIYALLPDDLGLSFHSFLPLYLIAATASVLSLVPGGLGVFETAMTMLTAPPSKAAALSAFFVYRMIYFVAPLLIALIGFAVHELRGKHTKRSGRIDRQEREQALMRACSAHRAVRRRFSLGMK